MKKLLPLVLLISLFFFSCHKNVEIEEEKALTTFVLVRHAEKSKDDPRDPSLSEEGKLRAQKLALHLSPMHIDAIYSTNYKRTITTAEPTAELKNLEVQVYDYSDSLLLDNFLKAHSGGTILISGHSNTTPTLVNKLMGKEKYSSLDEMEFDKLFIVTLAEIGKAKVEVLSY